MEHNKTSNPAGQWLDRATAGIRFKPDREEVRAELSAHLEDKALDFQRIFPDLTEAEAQERAAAEMGDPEEVGRELAKLHRPWLGYLWRLSQWALGVVILVLVLTGVTVIGSSSTLGGWYGREGDWRSHQDGAVFLAPPAERITLENCTLTVPKAAVWTGGEEQALEVVLRMDSFRFWEKDGGQFEQISATDDLGGYYCSAYEWGELGLWSGQYVSVHRDGWGPFHQTYRLQVTGIDPAAQWVCLDYDWMGRAFSLTIQLEEAEA